MSEILVESVFSRRKWLEKEEVVARLLKKGWVRIVEVPKPKVKPKKPEVLAVKDGQKKD